MVNAGFEDPVLVDGVVGTPADWTAVAGGGDLYNPTAAEFPAEAPEGSNVISIFAGADGDGFSQILGGASGQLQVGATYALTVQVGNPANAAWDGYKIQLLANGTVLAEDDNTVAPADGTWATATVNYIYDVADAALVGEALEIRLLTKGLQNGDTEFDDVQLTVTLASPVADPGGPYTLLPTDSLSLDGSSSLPSDGNDLTTPPALYEWDLDNDGSYDVTGVTPAAITYADLQGTWGMVLGANTIQLRVTDSGSNTSTTAGTVNLTEIPTLLIYEPFDDLDPNLQGNTPGLGIPGVWESSPNSSVAAESLKYGAIATQGGRMTANLGGSNFQKSEVSAQTLIDNGLLDDGATVWFSVIMVKHPVGANSNRRTYFSLGTGPPDGFDRIQTGPDSSGDGSGFTVVCNKVSDTGITAQAWNDGSDGNGGAARGATDQSVADGDTFLAVGKITWGAFGTPGSDVFELYLPSEDLTQGPVVSTISADFDQLGTSDPANTFAWIGIGGGHKSNNAPQLDEIRFGGTYESVTPIDTVAPAIVSTDPVDDSPAGNGSVQVATFDKDLIVGTGDIRIVNDTDVVTTTIPVGDPQVVVSGNTLTITPTTPLIGGKAYHIEMDSGVVTNLGAVDFGGISDPTEWNFIVDGVPPTVDTFADDTSPLPVLTNSSLTYTVTFNEPIDAATIGTEDFMETAGSAPITVDSVTATGDPAVYDVAVSTLGTPGTLTLEIVMGAVITDLGGSPLDTTTAIPSDNTINVNAPTPNAGSITNDFQGTIASQNNPNTGGGEGRWFHVSVNPANAGTGWYCADLPGTGDDAPAGVRKYTGPVVAYKFLGNGSDGDVTSTAGSGGDDARITYATEDTSFDGFSQQQLRLWEDNDPGADLATGAGTGATGFNDNGNAGYRDWSGATGTVDISGMASGSIHIYYGNYNGTPTVKVTMKDSDNVAADIVINDVHSIADGGNGDSANNGEYYLAEVDFVTDGFYDIIEYEWVANNGRGLGTVLTGPDVAVGGDYETWAAIYDPADLTDPDADFDGDNLSNNYERLFGLDPTDPASTNPISVPLDTMAGTFNFTRRDPALTGLFTDVETSTDLEMWTVDGGAVLVPGAADSNGIQTVAVTLSAGLLSAQDLFVRINQNDGILLSENFESGNGGFTVDTTAGTMDWTNGAPTSTGPGGTVSGGNGGSTNCFGTDIGNPGYFADGVVTTALRSTVIDLTNVAAAELSFAEAIDLQGSDVATVNIIEEATDTVISSMIYTADDAGAQSDADWNNVGPIAIPAGALGQKVRIEWLFDGDNGVTNQYLGWYIDDVTVTRTP